METLSVAWTPAFAGAHFDRPVWVGEIPDIRGHFLVLEQPGLAQVVEPTGATTPFLDLRAEVQLPIGYTEEGLLACAFHPGYATNRTLFTWSTTRVAGRLQTVLSRWRTQVGVATVDLTSRQILLTLDQPWPNHNGGDLHFGPDGFLYLSIGDGGSGGDPGNRAQNAGVLFGKIIRLDVDHADPGLPYAIPRDNPLVGMPGCRGEIWALGLRNPWRMAFDRVTGDLWAADVGQNRWEEVDLIVRGGNYGWRAREGAHPFKAAEINATMIDPVWEYGRPTGLSITGGVVYRGAAIPALAGAYLCADWVTRKVWAVRRGPAGGAAEVRTLAEAPGMPTSFGTDAAGDVYLAAYDGIVYRLTMAGAP
jgi:glucose/arabinose dehydrogenase